MSARWESSRKSLFVKTVWVCGHRHVILFEEDPLAEYLKLTTKKSSRLTSSLSKSSLRSSKSQKSSSCENFRVPSVKLLLAGIRNLKKEKISSRRTLQEAPSFKAADTVSIDIIPNDKVKFKNIDDDVLITQKENYNQRYNNVNLLKAVKISRMSNSLDIDYLQDRIKESEYYNDHYETHNLLTPQYSNVNTDFSDQYNNSLSDRVLMWLDLATQSNENIEKNKDIVEKLKSVYSETASTKSKVITAHTCSNLRKQDIFCNTKMLSRSRSYDYYESKVHVDEASKKQKVAYLKTTEIPTYSTMKINNLEESPLTCENFLNFTSPVPQVSSRPEDPPTMKSFPSEHANLKHRTEILKRQLHIFMPNIPKKSDDCDSSLSSKSSSLIKRCSL